jgi:hypothetical protein
MTPKEYDLQNKVDINRWIDIDSAEAELLDDNREFTKKCIKLGFEDGGPSNPPFLFLDFSGRIWGKGKDNSFYPFHLEYGKQLIGLKISKKALN